MALYLLVNTAAHAASSVTTAGGATAASGYSLNDALSGPRSTVYRSAASTGARELGYVFAADVTTTHVVVARADWLLTRNGSRVRAIQRDAAGTWSFVAGVDLNPLTAANLVGPRSQDLVFAVSPTQLRGIGLSTQTAGGTAEAMQVSKVYAAQAFSFDREPKFQRQMQSLEPGTPFTPPDRGFPYEVEQRFSVVFESVTEAKFAAFDALPQVRNWPLFLYNPEGNHLETKLEHVLVEGWLKQNQHNSGRCDLAVSFLRLRHYD